MGRGSMAGRNVRTLYDDAAACVVGNDRVDDHGAHVSPRRIGIRIVLGVAEDAATRHRRLGQQTIWG